MTRKQTFSKVKVGLLQMASCPQPRDNLEKVREGIGRAADQGVQILCLQELFRSQYFCQTEDDIFFDLAEPIPGPTTEVLSGLARRHRMAMVVPLFERRTAGVYHNTAVVLDADGALLGSYRKMHIPDDPLYYEKFYFTPGDRGYPTFETRYGSIGVLVCWDQWYPEAARLIALGGAQILFFPTAIGWHPSEKQQYGAAQQEAWKTIQRSHAIANGIFVASVNRVGYERSPEGEGLEFWGGSFLCDPFGVVLTEASRKEELVVAECDWSRIEAVRRQWPFLRDRRIDSYAPIVNRLLDHSPPG
ncbi:MAG: carbon-nitrogen hydrolase [Acidobacteriota bacterium]|nr:carbon-nitrogen hydrolase [Acidobacteriota bacterium]